MDAVGVPLYTTDAEGRLLYYNDAAAEFWGWDPPLGDKDWGSRHRVFRPDGSPMSWEESAVAQALREGLPVRRHRAMRERPDGTLFSLEAYATPIRDFHSRLLGAVTVLLDTTERERANARARDAAVAKTRFLASMSHELRTPIHAVLGFADLLADVAQRGEPLTPEHAEWIGEMQAAGRHLMEVVSDAIAFSEATIADARPVLRLRPTLLGSIVSDAVATAARAFAVRGLSVVREGPEKDTAATLDPSAARQALLSILREVARHMPEGGNVHIAWGKVAAEAVSYISLRCPGLTLPPDLLCQIDVPFAGADLDIYSRGLQGAGLSVATAAALIRGHAGDLRVSAGHNGEPVAFRLTFPLAPGASNADLSAASAQGSADPETPLLANTPSPIPRPTFSLADVVAAAGDVVLVTAADLDMPGPTIVYVNPAFTRVTGYAAEEVLGRTPRLLQGADTSRVTLDRIYDDLRAGREAWATLVNYTKTGKPYWVEMHIVPLRDKLGQITHFAAIERVVDSEWGSGGDNEADRDYQVGQAATATLRSTGVFGRPAAGG